MGLTGIDRMTKAATRHHPTLGFESPQFHSCRIQVCACASANLFVAGALKHHQAPLTGLSDLICLMFAPGNVILCGFRLLDNKLVWRALHTWIVARTLAP